MSQYDGLRKAYTLYVTSETHYGLPPRPETVRQRKMLVDRFIKYLESHNLPLSYPSFMEYVAELRKETDQEGTILAHKRQIKSWLNFMRKFDMIEDKDCFADKISIRGVPAKEFKFITLETWLKILEEAKKPSPFDNHHAKESKEECYQASLFMLKTGFRVGETRNLDGHDFEFEAPEPGFLAFVKGTHRAKVWTPIPKDMTDELKKRSRRAKMFDIQERAMIEFLRRGARALKLNYWRQVTTHWLRKTFINNLANNEVYAPIVQSLAHHSRIETTLKYYTLQNRKGMYRVLNSTYGTVKNGLNTDEYFNMAQKAIEKLNLPVGAPLEVKITRGKKLTIEIGELG